MTSVKINKPINIAFEILEIEDRFPSIKMAVSLNILHSTGHISYKAGNVWFECSRWDEFALSLNKVDIEKSSKVLLESMSENFLLRISTENNKVAFGVKIIEANSNGGLSEINFSSSIDDDVLGSLKEAFSSLDKWW